MIKKTNSQHICKVLFTIISQLKGSSSLQETNKNNTARMD